MNERSLLGVIAVLVLIVGLLIGFLVGGGGGDDESPDLEAAGSDGTTPTTTTEAPAATTTLGESAEESASSTTTTPTTTTEAPTTTTTTTMPPGSGVIVTGEGVAGWSVAGEWRSLVDGPAPAVPGETYQVVRVGEPVTTAVGGALTEGCPFVEPSSDVEGLIDFDDYPDYPVAVAANWNVVPHAVELLPVDNPTYQTAVSELLAGYGIVDPAPELRQVIRTDLEGDGTDEIIITAGYDGPFFPEVPAGSYSLAILRKVVDVEVETAILGFYQVPADSEPTSYIDQFRIAAVADLNGDGQMEIVVNDSYYEGYATTVYEWVNADLGPVAVLGAGCGV